jgi:hypothetical protein
MLHVSCALNVLTAECTIASLPRTAGSAIDAAAAAAQDADVGASAARLLPGMLGSRHASASRSLVAAPDGHPLLGSVPGFDAGRVVLAVGAPQHAPALARAGAFTAACAQERWMAH